MSTRKYELGYSKLQKKRRVETLIASQKGVMDKFIKIDKKNELENIGGCSLNEQDNNLDIGESNNREVVSDEDNYNFDSQTHDNEKEIERLDDSTLKKKYDPSQLKNIDMTLRDLSMEKGPIKVTDMDFPKNKYSRHFSSSNYIKKLPNWEKHERKWLIYSRDLDRVFLFLLEVI